MADPDTENPPNPDDAPIATSPLLSAAEAVMGPPNGTVHTVAPVVSFSAYMVPLVDPT